MVEYMENKPVGDILLPEGNVVADFSMFVVRAVGEGYLSNNGFIPLPIKVGDRVKLRASANGNMTGLELWFVNDRKLAIVDIEHVLGVWEGDLPSAKIMRNIVKGHANGALVVN